MTAERVVVVGAGLAGSRCAQTPRAEGFEGEITLVGEERHPPYERPALSKQFLAGARSELELQPPAYWEDNDITLLLGTRVDRIEGAQKLVWTARRAIGWDALVLATGARPRHLPGLSGPGVHVLRTLADARRLCAQLISGRRLVIAGAGFIGTEVASTALALGLEVTLINRGRLPFENMLGEEVGRLLAHRYHAHGVDLRPETLVTQLRRDGAGARRAVALSNGAELACDLLLVAAGAEPAGELLGLPAGIATDEAGRTALPDVYACGDGAASWHPALARHLRLEHWSSAVHQATTVARAILGHETTSASSPYFWSDQFGFRLQHVGVPAGWTRVALYAGADSLEAHYLTSDDRLIAALLVNKPDAVSKLRRQLATEPLAA